jgi:hypothetical protein
LLATTSRLDATVRLQWVGVGGRHVEIGLFDVALEAQEGELWPSYTDLMRAIVLRYPRYFCTPPLADPAKEYGLEDGPPAAYRLRRFAPSASAPGGPWLVYGRVDDRFRIRPRVVFTRPAPNRRRTRLLELVLSSDTLTRRQDLPQLLQSDEVTEEEIEEARRLIVSFQPRIPLQSLDLAVALITAPDSAVRLLSTCSEKEVDMVLALEQEMNFLWCVTPVQAWRETFGGRKRLVKLMGALPLGGCRPIRAGRSDDILQGFRPATRSRLSCVLRHWRAHRKLARRPLAGSERLRSQEWPRRGRRHLAKRFKFGDPPGRRAPELDTEHTALL